MCVITALLSLLSQAAAAQSTTSAGGYVESRYDFAPLPPSPKVAQLGEFGNIPVDYYTGLPDVKVPIYTYRHKGLTVPIYLAYHSTGLLVDAQASEVGLGWSLRAGGVIGRTLYGYSDLNPGGYATGASVPSQKQVSKLYDFYKQTAQHHQRDSEPDVYNFTYGTESGRFVLDSTATPHTIPYKDVRIVRIDDGRYTITDEQGIQYLFGGLGSTRYREWTRTEYGSECTMPPPGDPTVDNRREFVSASYLTHMISPTKDTIYFRYTPDTVSYRNPIDYTLQRLQLAPYCEPIYNYNRCYTTTVHTGYKISEITSSTGVRVRFTYARAGRLDAPTTHQLDAIEVTDGTTRKRFTLHYSYFTANQPADDPLVNALNYRLRLDAVQEQGIPPHRFSYHTVQGQGFPVRGSFSQDALGYFNGQPNTALLKAEMLDDPQAMLEPTPVLGVNRCIDTAAVKLGMLERITYPTGGISRLTYEANDYFVDRHFAVDSLAPVVLLQVGANDDQFPKPSNQVQQTFTLVQPTKLRVHCHLQTPVMSETAFSAYIVSQETGQGVYAMAPGPEDKRTITLPAGTYTMTAYAQDLEGNPAYLRVDVAAVYTLDRYVGNYPFYGCRIKSIVSSGKTSFGEDATTFYSYRQLAAPAAASGYVLYQPRLTYPKQVVTYKQRIIDVNVTVNEFYICDYDVLNQSPVNPVGSIHGGNIAYAAVTVTNTSRQADIRTQYVYSNVSDRHIEPSYPFPPPTSYDWQRGQLLKKISLINRGSGQYDPIQITRHEYTVLHSPSILEQVGGTLENDGGAAIAEQRHETIIPAYRVLMVQPEVNTNGKIILGQYRGYQYFYVSAFQHLASEETTTYGPRGDSTTTRTLYSYASPRHTQPTTIKTLTSTGDTVLTRLTYAPDYALPATPALDLRVSALQRLQALHITTPVLERTTHLIRRTTGSVLLNGQLTEYALVNQVPLPTTTWRHQPAGPAPFAPLTVGAGWTQDPQYRVDQTARYGADYQVVELLDKGRQASCFLRGPDQEVIAVTRNATLAQVAYTSFEPGSDGSWTYAAAQRVAGGRTGRWAYRLGSTAVRREGLPADTYRLQVWATEPPTVRLNGAAVALPPPAATAPGGWHQYHLRLSVPAGATLSLEGTALVDDVRLHPVGALMTTYTHEPLVGVTSQTGPDGRTSLYEYDALGRLLRVRDEQGHILSQQEYQYATQP